MFRMRQKSHQKNARKTSNKPKAEMIRRYMQMRSREDEGSQIEVISSGDETTPIETIHTNGMFDEPVPSVSSTKPAVVRPSTSKIADVEVPPVSSNITAVVRPTTSRAVHVEEPSVSVVRPIIRGVVDEPVSPVSSVISVVDGPTTSRVVHGQVLSVSPIINPAVRPITSRVADEAEPSVSSIIAASIRPTTSRVFNGQAPSLSSIVTAVVRPTTSRVDDGLVPSASSILTQSDRPTISMADGGQVPSAAPVRIAVVRPFTNKVAGLQVLSDRSAFRCARVRSQAIIPNRPDREHVPIAVIKPYGFAHSPSGSSSDLTESDGITDSSRMSPVSNLIPSSLSQSSTSAQSPATYHVTRSTKSKKCLPTPKGQIKNRYINLICPGKRQRLRKVIKRSRGSRNRRQEESRAVARARADAMARRSRIRQPPGDNDVNPENKPKKSVREIYLCPKREQFRRKQRYMSANTCSSSSDETASSDSDRVLYRVRRGVKRSSRRRNILLIRRMLKASLGQQAAGSCLSPLH